MLLDVICDLVWYLVLSFLLELEKYIKLGRILVNGIAFCNTANILTTKAVTTCHREVSGGIFVDVKNIESTHYAKA